MSTAIIQCIHAKYISTLLLWTEITQCIYRRNMTMVIKSTGMIKCFYCHQEYSGGPRVPAAALGASQVYQANFHQSSLN